MREIIIEMSQMSDSKELYHSKPPMVCVAFLYAIFFLCISCFIWICNGSINVVIEGHIKIKYSNTNNTRQLEDDYYMEIPISSCDMQWVEPGMKVRCSMEALPASEYGFVEGIITEISPNLYIDENGKGYYIVKASIHNTKLLGSNGKMAFIQEDMIGEAKIVAGTQRVLDYIITKK